MMVSSEEYILPRTMRNSSEVVNSLVGTVISASDVSSCSGVVVLLQAVSEKILKSASKKLIGFFDGAFDHDIFPFRY